MRCKFARPNFSNIFANRANFKNRYLFLDGSVLNVQAFSALIQFFLVSEETWKTMDTLLGEIGDFLFCWSM
jgi:hypothetical protein